MPDDEGGVVRGLGIRDRDTGRADLMGLATDIHGLPPMLGFTARIMGDITGDTAGGLVTTGITEGRAKLRRT